MPIRTTVQPINFNNTVQPKVRTTFKANTTCAKDYPADTVEIGGKKKTGISAGAKAGIGLGIISTIGIIITYAIKKAQVKNIKNIQKTFQEVFLRNDITESEAREILNRYKEIEKIKDKKEYIRALFEEAKKNYRMDDTDIKLAFDLTCEGAKKASGFYRRKDNLISVTTTKSRHHILNTIHHEFRHAVQYRAAQSSERSAELKALTEKYVDEFITKNPDISTKDFKFFLRVKDILKKAQKELAENGLPKDDKKITELLERECKNGKITFIVPKEYTPWVDKCIEQLIYKNYRLPDQDFKKYYEAFMEKDARYAGSAVDKFVKGKAFSLDWLLNKNGSRIN